MHKIGFNVMSVCVIKAMTGLSADFMHQSAGPPGVQSNVNQVTAGGSTMSTPPMI